MDGLRYVDEGPRDAPPLLLVGGIGTTARMWEQQIATLSGPFRVVAPDLRGHGGSPVPPDPYSIADLGGDVLDLMDQLGIGTASYCGLSLGGMVGAWLASTVPARIDRLVLACTAVRVDPLMWHERVEQVRKHGLGALVETTMERWFSPEFRHDRRDVVGAIAADFASTPVAGFVGCCHAIAGLEVEARLGSITAPTLLVSAQLDRTMPAEEAERIAAVLRSAGTPATTADVGRAAHLANVEQPERFTTLVAGHLTA